jgi:hypothetical protein
MTDECKLGSSAPINRWPYVRPVTFHSYVHRLSDEHKLGSSAINIYSSVFDQRLFLSFL